MPSQKQTKQTNYPKTTTQGKCNKSTHSRCSRPALPGHPKPGKGYFLGLSSTLCQLTHCLKGGHFSAANSPYMEMVQFQWDYATMMFHLAQNVLKCASGNTWNAHHWGTHNRTPHKPTSPFSFRHLQSPGQVPDILRSPPEGQRSVFDLQGPHAETTGETRLLTFPLNYTCQLRLVLMPPQLQILGRGSPEPFPGAHC